LYLHFTLAKAVFSREKQGIVPFWVEYYRMRGFRKKTPADALNELASELIQIIGGS